MASPQAFFLQAPHTGDQRYALFHEPNGACLGRVLYLHPLGEEMNKSRRMAARQARALAEQGFAVLQLDLHGCGDSAGDFADATWDNWLQDGALGVAWLNAKVGHSQPLHLWGLRGGCLLAQELAPRLHEPCSFLFWQAPASGKVLLQQFLRLKIAALMDGGGKEVMEQMRQTLAQGGTVEIAGYGLSAALAKGLEAATLKPVAGGTTPRRVIWAEVSRSTTELLPVSQTLSAQWQAAGFELQSAVVDGPTFWMTTEIEDAPALLDLCSQLMVAPIEARGPAPGAGA